MCYILEYFCQANVCLLMSIVYPIRILPSSLPSNRFGHLRGSDHPLSRWFPPELPSFFGGICYTIVKVDGGIPKRWLNKWDMIKPIHGSCAIYFPGGILYLSRIIAVFHLLFLQVGLPHHTNHPGGRHWLSQHRQEVPCSRQGPNGKDGKTRWPIRFWEVLLSLDSGFMFFVIQICRLILLDLNLQNL